jgi:Tfp pilus assembly protein PilV
MADETSETQESPGGPEVIPTTAGNVYVFNVTQAQIQMLLNNTFVANLPVAGVQSKSYQPTATSVQRIVAGSTQTGQFADSNTMTLGSTNNYNYKVSLPTTSAGPGTPVYPYSSDVLLFVFNTNVVICTPDGNNYQSLSGTPTSTPPGENGSSS